MNTPLADYRLQYTYTTKTFAKNGVFGNFAPLGGHLPRLRVARLAVEGAALMDWTGTVKRVSRIAEEFHLVSNSSESSTEYRCKFSLKSALQYEIAFTLTGGGVVWRGFFRIPDIFGTSLVHRRGWGTRDGQMSKFCKVLTV